MPKAEEDIQKDKEKLLDSLKECSGIVTFACEKVGLSRQTFYRWYREDAEFKDVPMLSMNCRSILPRPPF